MKEEECLVSKAMMECNCTWCKNFREMRKAAINSEIRYMAEVGMLNKLEKTK